MTLVEAGEGVEGEGGGTEVGGGGRGEAGDGEGEIRVKLTIDFVLLSRSGLGVCWNTVPAANRSDLGVCCNTFPAANDLGGILGP